MSEIKRTVRSCDVCGSENDVARVRIQIGGVRRSGDVCGKHRKSLESLLAKLPDPKARGILAVPVLDEEEWERRQKGATKVRRAAMKSGSSGGATAPGLTGGGR